MVAYPAFFRASELFQISLIHMVMAILDEQYRGNLNGILRDDLFQGNAAGQGFDLMHMGRNMTRATDPFTNIYVDNMG